VREGLPCDRLYVGVSSSSLTSVLKTGRQWAYAGSHGWDVARLRPVFQKVETYVRNTPERQPRHEWPHARGPLAEPNPLTAGFFKACEEMGHQVVEDVGAPIRDGAGYVDFNTKNGQRFSVVHGYLLPALQRRNLTVLTARRFSTAT
jgi:choline dehydrogenase